MVSCWAQRITPACAGKRTLLRTKMWQVWDHPRMRGEEDGLDFGALDDMGSPPHARGRVLAKLAESEEDGITPACAGKSVLWDDVGVRR